MSEGAPFPGAWLASDGRWYPAEFHPARQGRPAAGTATVPPSSSPPSLSPSSQSAPDEGEGPPPVPHARPRGRPGGRRWVESDRRRVTLAVAALGALVVAAIGLALASGSSPSAPSAAVAPVQSVVRVGQPVVLDPRTTGMARARVLSISTGVPAVGHRAPDPGHEFTAVGLQVCAGAHRSVGPAVSGFSLVLPDGSAVPVPAVTTLSPSLWQANVLGARQCLHGYLTYQVPTGTTPVGVRFTGPGRNVLWES